MHLSKPETADPVSLLRDHPAIGALRQARIGLVLAGGGAKGAYEAGALQALFELDLTNFCVIVGTSVGALNAAAAGARRIPAAVDFWGQLRLPQITRLDWSLGGAVLGAAIDAVTSVFLSKSRRIALVGLIVLLVVALIGATVDWRWFLVACFLVSLAPLFWILWVGLGSPMSSWLTSTLATRSAFSTNAALHDSLRRALFPDETSSLRLQCPTFVTVARETCWFDPDFPTFALAGSDTASLDGLYCDTHKPVEKSEWLPEYRDISGQLMASVLDLLLRSTALPFLFRSRVIDQQIEADGGLADNIPLNKALEYDCDAIIVIHLSSENDLPQQILDRIPHLRRALKLAASNQAELHGLYLEWLAQFMTTVKGEEITSKTDDGRSVPVSNHFWYWGSDRYFHYWNLPQTGRPEICALEPVQRVPPLVHVVPSRHLGGLFGGTLNFGRSRARQLLALGHADAVRALRQFANREVDLPMGFRTSEDTNS